MNYILDYITLFSFVSSLLKFGVFSLTPSQEADLYLSTPELITKNGYNAETHTVTTSDGYILNMHRITYSPKFSASTKKPVVFLQHGLGASSSDYVILGANYSLAYLLADAGYDVFLGNCRGNVYSEKHVNLTIDDEEYWNFSFQEMAKFDLPAEIDYVLELTNETQVYLLAESMGTTITFVFAAERPEYNRKIRLLLALAPTTMAPIFQVNKSENSSTLTEEITGLFFSVLRALGMKHMEPGRWFYTWLGENICNTDFGGYLCGLSLVAHTNKSLLPMVFTHISDGTSFRTLEHWLQMNKAGIFQNYDYGPELNLVKYKQESPPPYNLSAVTSPVIFLFAQNDNISPKEEMNLLCRVLAKCVGAYEVPEKNFTHMDFSFGMQARSVTFGRVVEILQEH